MYPARIFSTFFVTKGNIYIFSVQIIETNPHTIDIELYVT